MRCFLRSGVRSVVPALVVLATGSEAVAVSVDLSTPGASGAVNGAWFSQVDLSSTDVGDITPVLRLQGPGGSGGVTGYNTDARPVQFDEKAQFTRSVLLTSVPVVIRDGVAYRELLLNSREPAATSKHLVSMDGLSVFLSPNGSPSGVSLLDPAAALGLPVYSLDAGGDNAVVIDAALSKGNGHYDVAIDIPVDAFPASGNAYLTLLATFGLTDASSGAYEEFAVGTFSASVPSPVPLPGALATGGSMLAVLGVVGRLSRRRSGRA
jgi:hypothetical protein